MISQSVEDLRQAPRLIRNRYSQNRSDRKYIMSILNHFRRFFRIVHNDTQNTKILRFRNGHRTHINFVFR